MSMLSRFATLGGAATDPYWANVSLLLVGNGANNSTTNLIDSSSNHISLTNNGSVVISTVQNKYDSGSVYFNGSQYLQSAASNLFTFGTDDFTIEGWFYPTVNTSVNTICSSGGPTVGSVGMYLTSSGKIEFACYGGSNLDSVTTVTKDNWHYICACRSGTTLRMYLDGNLDASATNTFNNTGSVFYIGALWGAPSNGYLYDLRVTKGVARYTGSTMTVPTGPLPTTGP